MQQMHVSFFFFWDLNCGVKVIGPNRLFQLCGIMEQKKKKAPKSETNIKSSGKKKSGDKEKVENLNVY